MKVIVGIGNIGKEYENTRHNIGFNCLDNYINKNNITTKKEKFSVIYYETTINAEKVYLLKPQKFVNLTGECVYKFMDYYKINVEDMLVIVDDLDLDVGIFKLKYKGSSGGHNGLKSIEEAFNTKEYKRLKIGISNNKNIDTKNYVLGKFSKEDRKMIDSIIENTMEIINDFIVLPFEKLMSKYNC